MPFGQTNPVGYGTQRMQVVGDPLKSQVTRVQRPELPEDLWQPLYDRINLVSAGGSLSSEYAFFSTPKGQSATLITGTAAPASKTKTFRDTNLDQAGVVPTKLFKFIGISMMIVHGTKNSVTNSADRDLFFTGGFLRFRIVDKDILILPLTNFPEQNPISSVATTANNSTITAQGAGGGQGIKWYPLPINITLNPYENFSVVMDFDGTVTLTGAMDVGIVLQGFMRRPT